MPERRGSVAPLRPVVRRLLAAILTIGLVPSSSPRAAQPEPHIRLLSAPSRASIVIEVDDATSASALETTDERTIAVEIGPVHGRVTNQVLHAPAHSPLVSRVRVLGITRGSGGTIITIYITATAPVSGFVRRASGRVYIDVVPQDGSRVVERPVTAPFERRAPAASAAPGAPRPAPALPRRDAKATVTDPPASAPLSGLIATQTSTSDRPQPPERAQAPVEPQPPPVPPEPSLASARPEAPEARFANEFNALKSDVMLIARAAGAWAGGPPPAAFDSLSAVLPRLHSLQAPAELSSAYLSMCASLDQLVALWATTSTMPPPPGQLRIARGAAAAVDDLLQLELRYRRASGR